jgi:ABC-type antimicrobial peptide transport system permease subunit
MIEHYNDAEAVGFSWAASAASTPEEKANPWLLLSSPAGDGKAIPVVLDKNTAMYSLHLYRGIGEEFEVAYDGAQPLKLKVAGLLSNSVLQGSVLMGEADFLRQFPEIGGYRFFLVQAPAENLDQVSAVLEDKLGDQGFDAVPTSEVLTQLLAVQNTYLSTFQSLGALGLLLGTFGLATVQLRSVLERRGELALLRAQGFRRSRVARLILSESVLLLIGGLATGAIAALIAVLPHMILGGAQINLGELLVMLAAVLVIGLAASLVAVRATLRAGIIAALRGE